MATGADPRIVFSADDRVSRVLGNIQRELVGMQGAATRLGAVLGPLGGLATLTAGLGAGVLTIKNFAGSIDDLADSAEGLGVTAVALAELRSKAAEAGVESNQLDLALGKLNEKIGAAAAGNREAVATFGAMGVSLRDANGQIRSTEAILGDVADRFASYANTAERGALAAKLFGERAGRDLVAYLAQGSGALRQFTGLTDDSVREAQRLQGEIDKLATSFERLTNRALGAGAAAINAVLDALGGVEINEASQVLARLDAGIVKLRADLARETRPEFIEAIRLQLEQAEREAVRLRGTLGTVKEQLFGARGYGEGSARAPIVGDDGKAAGRAAAGKDPGQAFLDNLQKQAVAANYTAEQVLRIEAAQLGVSAAAEPWIRSLEAAKAAAAAIADEQRRINELAADEAQERSALATAWRAIADAQLADRRRLEELTGVADLNRLNRDLRLINDAYAAGELSLERYLAARRKAFGADAQADIRTTTDLARDLGLTFTSAFEDAVVEGKDLRDVINGLEKDLLRLGTRKFVTEPVLKGFESLLGPLLGSAFGGGSIVGYADSGAAITAGGAQIFDSGGYLAPGRFGIVREGPELVYGGRSGVSFAGTENTKQMMGGRSTVNNINITVPAGTSTATANQIAAAVAQQLAIADARFN